MTDAEAWEEIWKRKRDGREMFANAELTRDVPMSQWNGHDEPATEYECKAGQTVLITMASRFGDVGIRGIEIGQERHGYHARIEPEALVNVRFLSDGGKPWRLEILKNMGLA